MKFPLPYRFVRPGGRGGSCFANSYRRGAQFLLFLKKGWAGFTTNFSALGPTNEQLTGVDDPWVKWVRAYLSPCAGQNGGGIGYADMSRREMRTRLGRQATDLEKYRLAKCYVAKYGVGGEEAKEYIQLINSYETIPEPK